MVPKPGAVFGVEEPNAGGVPNGDEDCCWPKPEPKPEPGFIAPLTYCTFSQPETERSLKMKTTHPGLLIKHSLRVFVALELKFTPLKFVLCVQLIF